MEGTVRGYTQQVGGQQNSSPLLLNILSKTRAGPTSNLTGFKLWLTNRGVPNPDCETSSAHSIQQLQAHFEQVGRLEDALLEFSQWAKSFLAGLHDSTHVDVTELGAAEAQVKVGRGAVGSA